MHTAIILDGNRRWAKRRGLPGSKGHEKGFEKIKELLGWIKGSNIDEITLYCFSTENFNRDKKEVDGLFNMFRKKINELKKKGSIIHENKVSVRFIGKLDMFPEDMQESMRTFMDETRAYDAYKLNLAVAYGSKTEIVEAIKRIVSKGIKTIDKEVVSQNLLLSEDVDLMIRPGGEKRLSNFLLWQSAYAEIFFSDKLWPDFSKEDLNNAISWFGERVRRFGK